MFNPSFMPTSVLLYILTIFGQCLYIDINEYTDTIITDVISYPVNNIPIGIKTTANTVGTVIKSDNFNNAINTKNNANEVIGKTAKHTPPKVAVHLQPLNPI